METLENENGVSFTFKVLRGEINKSFGVELIRHMGFP
jgi:DNA mismatch repair ATPase MutS